MMNNTDQKGYKVYESIEAAEAELQEIMARPDWKESLTVDRNGEKTDIYTDRETAYRIAFFAPAGYFASEEVFDKYLRESILRNTSEIAAFMHRRVRARYMLIDFDHIVGQSVEVDDDGTITEKPCKKINLWVKRKPVDEKGIGIYIDFFSPFAEWEEK